MAHAADIADIQVDPDVSVSTICFPEFMHRAWGDWDFELVF